MLGVYASAATIVVASLLLGRAGLTVLGLTAPTWLSGAVGFAAMTIVFPMLIRLPGRAATASILIGLALIASILFLWRGARRGSWTRRADPSSRLGGRRPRPKPPIGLVVSLLVLAAASLPFAFNERNGVLGEGIYTNDQAAQLYWTNWLQHDTGPEPGPVRFGYPTGPQSIAAVAAESTNTSLLSSFNGLLLAIPVLTALTALAGLEGLPRGRRIIAASLTGLPYLGASFLAQSAFKETAMALLVLAFAVTLHCLASSIRGLALRKGRHPERAWLCALVILAAASLFIYSVPGLIWFALAAPIWLLLEGSRVVPWLSGVATGRVVRRHGHVILVAAILLVGVGVVFAAEQSGFID
jgi:hypothetical protein